MERSRAQPPSAPLRGAVSRPKRPHREVEQKRRMRVAEQIALLRHALCDSHAEKSDTVSVLQRAVHFVNVAQSTIATLKTENDALRRERLRVLPDWGAAAAAAGAAAVAASDALHRDAAAATVVSSALMQPPPARDCCLPSASRPSSTPWNHAQNGLTFPPPADRPAHFPPTPSSLPHFDMLRHYPQQPSHHPQQQQQQQQQQHPFMSPRSHHTYTPSPQLATHAAHVPPSAAQHPIAPVHSHPSQPLPHSSSSPSRPPSKPSYQPKPAASTPRDSPNM
ncbi:unnamed protein product [Agarophyton chilense]